MKVRPEVDPVIAVGYRRLDRRVGGVRIIGTRESTVPLASGLLTYKHYSFYPKSAILKAEIRRVKGLR